MSGLLDREGELIDDECECDYNHACNNPRCVMENEFTARNYQRQFESGALTAEGLAEGWLELDDDDEPRMVER